MRPFLLLAALATTVPAGAESIERQVTAVSRSAAFKAAVAALDAGHDKFVEEIVEITEIPAPPFAEAERGKAMAAKFREADLADIVSAPSEWSTR